MVAINESQLEVAFKISKGRQARPRCLKCWGDDTDSIRFDDSGFSDFTHSCGGRLHSKHGSWDDTRFSITLAEIHLDREGNVLRDY